MSSCESRSVPERQFIPYLFYVPAQRDINLAAQVSSMIQDEANKGEAMIPKTASEVKDIFSKRRSIVAIDAATGDLAGHAAFTEEYPNGTLEVGALIVGEKYRGNGLAKKMLPTLVEQGKRYVSDFGNRDVVAFANEASERSFTQNGYRRAERAEIPQQAWDLCKACPKNPGGDMCCDVPVILKK